MDRHEARRVADMELRGRLRELANERRRFGCRRLLVMLRREGEPFGISRIQRLYREDGGGSENGPGTIFPTTLTVRKRKARRKAVWTRAPILVEAQPNARWSLERDGTDNSPVDCFPVEWA